MSEFCKHGTHEIFYCGSCNKEAYQALQKENEKLLKFKEEMRKLGQAMPPNAISMMIQRELGKFGETNSSRVGG